MRLFRSVISAFGSALLFSCAGTSKDIAVECDGWNTVEFFETAAVADVDACLAAGADINARTQWRMTPLMLAASIDPVLAEVLLDAGADASLLDQRGNSALYFAFA